MELRVSTNISYRQLIDAAHDRNASHKHDLEDLIEYRQQKRARQEQDTDHLSPWLDYKVLQSINTRADFQPLMPAVSEHIERRAAKMFSDEQLDRKLCAVTDKWFFSSTALRLSMEDLPLLAMKMVLSNTKSWVTQAIRSYYDCSSYDSRLSGMLLSTRAIECFDNGFKIWMSKDALSTLLKLNSQLTSQLHTCDIRPPRFAIADCFVAGTFREIDEASPIELQTVGLVQTRGLVKVIYGGPGNMLQSHLLSWDNRHATIASRVPSVPKEEDFQIILAGPMAPNQELVLAKRFKCSGKRVLRLHSLLRDINPLYSTVEENLDFANDENSCQFHCTQLEANNETNALVNKAQAHEEGILGHSVSKTTDGDHETTMVESETILIETAIDSSEHERLTRAFQHITGESKTFVARRSTSFLQQNDKFYLERLFPHLLTFGIGGFDSMRAHRYSKRDIVIHYLNLSTNRFAEDSMFKLQMFDYLGSLRLKNGVFVSIRHDPDIAAISMRITPDQLRAAMETRAMKRRALQTGQGHANQHEANEANTVVKAMNAATAKMWGSNDERDAFQRKVDAMVLMFGEPSLFWTLTPNPDASIAVAFWTGLDLPGGRPKDLIGCTSFHMPNPTEMSRMVMGNTVVQAHYYQQCCHLLIDIIFGWDMTASKPKSEPGIFGYIEALFFALEQQGRLRVHHHGVAWVAGLPRCNKDWKKLLESPELRSKYEAYCASIFAAELPVFANINTISCPKKTCTGHLKPLPIPKNTSID